MSEPIWTQFTIAVPSWYVADRAGAPNEDRAAVQLRHLADTIREELYGNPEDDGELVGGELWQASGDCNYGINYDAVVPALEGLAELFVEFDAKADEKCEYEGERWSWRIGWPEIRSWTATPNEEAMKQSEFAAIRARHLDQFPKDYIGFVEELDAFWPPKLLITRNDPPTSAVA